jgi:hypothetical protein
LQDLNDGNPKFAIDFRCRVRDATRQMYRWRIGERRGSAVKIWYSDGIEWQSELCSTSLNPLGWEPMCNSHR